MARLFVNFKDIQASSYLGIYFITKIYFKCG